MIAKGDETPPAGSGAGPPDGRLRRGGATLDPVFVRSALLAGNVIDGPAVVEETAFDHDRRSG